MINPQEILVCPQTHQPLEIDWQKEIVAVKNAKHTYPIIDGIIDFIPDVKDDLSEMYDAMAPAYDDWMNSSNIIQKLNTWITWGFMDDRRYANWLLNRIPDDFDGVLLDVPCGTGILALEKYSKLASATIVTLDYSLEMLRRTQENFLRIGLKNVIYVRADAADLPVRDAVVDHLLSINGFHIYPDKHKALFESARVLKYDACFSGCFCVRGLRFLSDVFYRRMAAHNCFNSDFFNRKEVYSLFGGHFNFISEKKMGALLLFHASKKNNQVEV